MNNNSLISVVMSTYNHAPYVREAMESVLNQQDVAIEFLIADDGSKDNTVEVVQSIKHPSIVFTPHPLNRGACTVTNELIMQATGKYIAIISSDDIWHDPLKLKKQLEYLEQHPNTGACFGFAQFITKNGEVHVPKRNFFKQGNKSRGEWLRHFFDKGNCLCHPSILIRRECYDKLGLYNNRFRQLPDYDMWVRLIKHYDIHIIQEPLISFRILEGEQASAGTPKNMTRLNNENYIIAHSFFDNVDAMLLNQAFGDIIKNKESENLEINKAFCMVSSLKPNIYSLIGANRFFDLLNDPLKTKILKEQYNFDDLAFQELLTNIKILEKNRKVKFKDKIIASIKKRFSRLFR